MVPDSNCRLAGHYPMTLLIDSHEPKEAATLIGQSVPCHVMALNEGGYADYKWTTVEGLEVQVERKQWGELLSGLDAVEDQLRRHLQTRPDCTLYLLVEGLSVGTQSGTTLLKSRGQGNIYTEDHKSSIRLSQVYPWLYQISKYLQIFFTPGYTETCMALVAFYKNDQKAEHSTFQRYFKKVEFAMDPRVTQLMGLLPGIGEARAKALIETFTTVWNVVNATPRELQTVPGIGRGLSTSILRGIGRLDV